MGRAVVYDWKNITRVRASLPAKRLSGKDAHIPPVKAFRRPPKAAGTSERKRRETGDTNHEALKTRVDKGGEPLSPETRVDKEDFPNRCNSFAAHRLIFWGGWGRENLLCTNQTTYHL
jgi:hypothetical protein